MDASGPGFDEVSLKDLFDDAIVLSQNISGLSIEIPRIFLSTSVSSGIFSQRPSLPSGTKLQVLWLHVRNKAAVSEKQNKANRAFSLVLRDLQTSVN